MATYCDTAPGHPLHGPYHERLYGFPLKDDDELFGRLIMEINQAGLSWELILKRAEALRAGYSGFSIAKIAAYGDADRARLLADPGVIRNRRKVEAAIANAEVILRLQRTHGSFAAWLAANHPLSLEQWVRLFKQSGLRFVGREICNEFLMSTGFLDGAHRPDCPVYARIAALSPPFLATPFLAPPFLAKPA